MQKYNDRLTNLVQHVPGLQQLDYYGSNMRPSVLGQDLMRSGYSVPAKSKLTGIYSGDPRHEYLNILDDTEYIDIQDKNEITDPATKGIINKLIEKNNVTDQDVLDYCIKNKNPSLIDDGLYFVDYGKFHTKEGAEFWGTLLSENDLKKKRNSFLTMKKLYEHQIQKQSAIKEDILNVVDKIEDEVILENVKKYENSQIKTPPRQNKRKYNYSKITPINFNRSRSK